MAIKLKILPRILRKIADFVYPAYCLHCQVKTDGPYLCKSCLELLEWTHPKEHCPLCLSFSENTCCSSKSYPWKEASFALAYANSISSYLHAYKYNGHRFLAKTLASFLVVHLSKLSWPQLDYIAYVPQALEKKLLKGFSPTELLAQELGHILNIPVVNALKAGPFQGSRAGLNLEEREKVKPEYFLNEKEAEKLQRKMVLLIDDVYTTGSTAKAAASALQEAVPKGVYLLALCKALTS